MISKFYGVMMKGFSDEAKSNLPALLEGLEWFDSSVLAARANPFLHGKGSARPGLLDYMVWPWVYRARMFLRHFLGKDVMGEERFKNLVNIVWLILCCLCASSSAIVVAMAPAPTAVVDVVVVIVIVVVAVVAVVVVVAVFFPVVAAAHAPEIIL